MSELNFKVAKQDLIAGLGIVSRLATNRMPLPILNNILLVTEDDQIILSVTDLEIGIQTTIPAEVKKPGKFTVPARLFHEFIQSSNDLYFNGKVSDDATLHLTSEHTGVKIRGLDASEFPNLPFFKALPTFSLKTETLKEAVGQVLYATALDDTRPVLAGVLLQCKNDRLVLVATDSHRLAERSVKYTDQSECSVIVPKQTLLEVMRIIEDKTVDISVFVGDNQIQFGYKSTLLVSRLIEGNYPPYKTIIPDSYQTRVTAHVGDLTASLKTTQLFTKDAGGMVKCQISPGNGMIIQSVADQKGEAMSSLTAIAEGEELTIAFNAKYLLDALSVISSDNVFIEFSGPDRPAVLRPANSKEYFSLVMPLKID